MSVIVQKYGGSSVSSPEKILKVAERVVETRARGHKVVVVVSAMGNTTNELLELARRVSPHPERRELDMLLTVGERITMSLLSMAIQDHGVRAISFTGSQSGIITTNHHTNARITRVKAHRLREALNEDKVVIVAGFQGVSERLEITSLGRGGSDTTAIALAAALNADYAEICSDVDGVYSADPRVAPQAERVAHLSYEEMQQLSDSGAKVLNAEAVEWARRNDIEIICAATQGEIGVGTSISAPPSAPSPSAPSPVSPHAPTSAHEHPRASAVTHHPGLLHLYGAGEPSAQLFEVFERFGLLEIELTYTGALSTSASSSSQAWSAWVPTQNLHPVQPVIEAFKAAGAQISEGEWTLVSVVGRGLLGGGEGSPLTVALATITEVTRAHEAEGAQPEGIKLIGPEVSPSRLRWAAPQALAPTLVRALHDALISASR